ncbi:MAG: type III-B CRISPR module-associated protein Cmr5 [Lentisphaerae bacterium]|nr:type III-B CRISPR module-associated protein Cmr5 [Lentisphaerota bacterium]
MKNLDQIRAANALNAAQGNTFKGVNDGGIVKKVPTMIRENGFLGALAFACEKGKENKPKNGDHHKVFEVILLHLKDVAVVEVDGSSVDALMAHVVDQSSAKLREITAQSMAYLSYLRRFASKEDEA